MTALMTDGDRAGDIQQYINPPYWRRSWFIRGKDGVPVRITGTWDGTLMTINIERGGEDEGVVTGGSIFSFALRYLSSDSHYSRYNVNLANGSWQVEESDVRVGHDLPWYGLGDNYMVFTPGQTIPAHDGESMGSAGETIRGAARLSGQDFVYITENGSSAWDLRQVLVNDDGLSVDASIGGFTTPSEPGPQEFFPPTATTVWSFSPDRSEVAGRATLQGPGVVAAFGGPVGGEKAILKKYERIPADVATVATSENYSGRDDFPYISFGSLAVALGGPPSGNTRGTPLQIVDCEFAVVTDINGFEVSSSGSATYTDEIIIRRDGTAADDARPRVPVTYTLVYTSVSAGDSSGTWTMNFAGHEARVHRPLGGSTTYTDIPAIVGFDATLENVVAILSWSYAGDDSDEDVVWTYTNPFAPTSTMSVVLPPAPRSLFSTNLGNTSNTVKGGFSWRFHQSAESGSYSGAGDGAPFWFTQLPMLRTDITELSGGDVREMPMALAGSSATTSWISHPFIANEESWDEFWENFELPPNYEDDYFIGHKSVSAVRVCPPTRWTWGKSSSTVQTGASELRKNRLDWRRGHTVGITPGGDTVVVTHDPVRSSTYSDDLSTSGSGSIYLTTGEFEGIGDVPTFGDGWTLEHIFWTGDVERGDVRNTVQTWDKAVSAPDLEVVSQVTHTQHVTNAYSAQMLGNTFTGESHEMQSTVVTSQVLSLSWTATNVPYPVLAEASLQTYLWVEVTALPENQYEWTYYLQVRGHKHTLHSGSGLGYTSDWPWGAPRYFNILSDDFYAGLDVFSHAIAYVDGEVYILLGYREFDEESSEYFMKIFGSDGSVFDVMPRTTPLVEGVAPSLLYATEAKNVQ